jgi:anti-anti-sigma factor
MTVTKDRSGEKLVLLLEGRLDTTTAPQLQTELIPEFDAAKEIKLDFKGLDYVSSAGLRVLLMGEKTAKAKGGKMILTNVSEDVMEVLEMTGLSDVLTIE